MACSAHEERGWKAVIDSSHRRFSLHPGCETQHAQGPPRRINQHHLVVMNR